VSKENPKVTVLMPVYNGEKYLRDAVESILNQTFTDFEFLIINDGSTDGSAGIINSYCDPRICLVNNETNLKLVASLNKGLGLARGEYIARMDCDDISLPDRLAKQVAFMDAFPEYGLCGTNMMITDMGGNLISSQCWPETPVPLEWTLLWENPVAHPTVMLRTRTLQEFNLNYRDVPSEDLDLWCRLVLRAKIARLPEVLLHYRFHSDSAFNLKKKDHLLQAIRSSRDLAFAITQQDVPEFHGALTVYPGAMGEPSRHYEIRAVNEWLELLLEKCREKFNWDDLSYRYAKDDCRRLLARILQNP